MAGVCRACDRAARRLTARPVPLGAARRWNPRVDQMVVDSRESRTGRPPPVTHAALREVWRAEKNRLIGGPDGINPRSGSLVGCESPGYPLAGCEEPSEEGLFTTYLRTSLSAARLPRHFRCYTMSAPPLLDLVMNPPDAMLWPGARCRSNCLPPPLYYEIERPRVQSACAWPAWALSHSPASERVRNRPRMCTAAHLASAMPARAGTRSVIQCERHPRVAPYRPRRSFRRANCKSA